MPAFAGMTIVRKKPIRSVTCRARALPRAGNGFMLCQNRGAAKARHRRAREGPMLTTGIFKSRWWMVAAAAVALMTNTGVILNFSFAVFLKPITEDLGIGRATLASALVVSGLL